MQKLFILLILIFSYSTYGQCVPPNASSTGCTYSTTVNSTDGYQVVISVTPSSIIVPSSCQWGYSSNAVLNYDIQFTGSNIPANLWNLQFSLGCDPFSYDGSFPTSGGVGSSTSTNGPYRNVSDCSTVSFASLGCDVLNITISGPGISNQTIAVNCEAQSAHPAESSFGDNEWILFGYNGNNFGTYRGYYKNSSLGFDTRDSWNIATSPSNAGNYEGCSINNNQHSYKIKREGFPCGFYQINLLGHNNRVVFKVNDTQVYSKNSASTAVVNNIWSGFLDENSTIECTIRTMNNDSYAAFDLENVYGANYIVWNGDENSNYNNANNWCGGVIPSSTDSVLIPASTTNNLEINNDVIISDLLILENASMSIGDDKKITIKGNIANNGIINADAAILYFNGNGNQLISGNGFEINEVELDNSSDLTLNLNDDEQLTIKEHLIITSGALHTNNQIYLPCDYLSTSDVCSFTTDISSTTGYTVSINVTPMYVITASNACPSGYNYNIEYDYDVAFSGTNIPGSLYTLQGNLTCDTDNDSIFFNLPNSGGSGTATTTSNPYRNENDCGTVTVSSIGCDNISIIINGPGIENQTVNLSCDYGTTGGAAHIHAILGTIDGEVTVEQCYPGTRAWRFISSSVTSSGSIRENWQENANNWNDDPFPGYGTHITGIGFSSGANNDGLNGFDWNPSGVASMYSFNSTTQGWGAISNTDSDNLLAGKPYRILIRGSRSINIQSNSATPTNTKIRATGEIVKGPYQVPSLSDVPGNFNFVGNPFHAQVDMQKVLDEATNVIPYVYFWDPTVASRGAYVTINSLNNTNNNLSSDANIYLEPFQAVFVQTGDEETMPVITFKESHKVENQAPTTTFKSLLAQELSFINITLYNTESYNSDNSAVDGVRVDFSSEGNNEVDKFDALKVVNLDESISFKNENILLSMENRNYPESSEILPINITNYKSNEYVMKMKGTEIPGVDAFLVDYYTNTQTLINSETFTIYSFSVENQIVESKSPERFAIIFENEVLSNADILTTNDFNLFPNPVQNKLYVNTNSSDENAEVEIFNMLGQTIFNKKLNFNPYNQLEIANISFPSGYYIIKVTTNSGKIYQSKFLKE